MYKFVYLIKTDLARISEPSVKNFIRVYCNPHSVCFRYIVNLRILQAAKKSNLLCRLIIGVPAHIRFIFREILHDINTNTNIKIGEGLHIIHGGGIFLNVSEIGDNFTVFQNVTFGKRHANDGVPSIGNNVTCCTGAVICGGIKLGDNCTVGANSYVNKDVPEGALVAGLPAKIIKKS